MNTLVSDLQKLTDAADRYRQALVLIASLPPGATIEQAKRIAEGAVK